MRQILQSLSTGQIELIDCPDPQYRAGWLLVDSKVSLLSAGTERMLFDFAQAGLLSKARSQPERAREFLRKASVDGVYPALEAVRDKLNTPIAMGYCSVGVVRHSGVASFRVGDRVVSNGAHAEVVSVPRNLCAKIPDSVSDEAASFTVAASIGLQGLRLAEPTLGEAFVVTGVGLIGLLTVQLLRAQGCRVLAIDIDPARLELARRFGAEICNPSVGQDPVAVGMAFSRQRGVDGVIITASTKSSEPITQAARMCRKRGRIVLVGVTGIQLDRSDFYAKELSFQVSCSYGPGRYDTAYEERGQDYPFGFVRWTEQRNFEAVLDMMASGVLDVAPLISHRPLLEEAPRAYHILSGGDGSIGILLLYRDAKLPHYARTLTFSEAHVAASGRAVVGFVGAGNYSSRILIPAFKATGATLHSIASAGGTSAAVHGRRAGFLQATSDTDGLIANPEINVVTIVTRHDNHGRLAAQALRAGKHVFVEKPLALTHLELADVEEAHQECEKLLMVGFNRRFAPQVKTMKGLLEAVTGPKAFVMVMNAKEVPSYHWTQDPVEGGGRIIGEACHHIDLMRFLAGAPITSVQARCIRDSDADAVSEDKAAITLGFDDGSFGTIHYLANGGPSFPKERVEVFVGGRTLQLENFLTLRGFNWPGFKKHNLWRQDKGQRACTAAFVKAVEEGGVAPIPAAELFEVTKVAIEVAEILRSQQ